MGEAHECSFAELRNRYKDHAIVGSSKAQKSRSLALFGGLTDGAGKKKDNVLYRTLVTLDFDYVLSVRPVLDVLPCAYWYYTTWGHTTDEVKARVVCEIPRTELHAYVDYVKELERVFPAMDLRGVGYTQIAYLPCRKEVGSPFEEEFKPGGVLTLSALRSMSPVLLQRTRAEEQKFDGQYPRYNDADARKLLKGPFPEPGQTFAVLSGIAGVLKQKGIAEEDRKKILDEWSNWTLDDLQAQGHASYMRFSDEEFPIVGRRLCSSVAEAIAILDEKFELSFATQEEAANWFATEAFPRLKEVPSLEDDVIWAVHPSQCGLETGQPKKAHLAISEACLRDWVRNDPKFEGAYYDEIRRVQVVDEPVDESKLMGLLTWFQRGAVNHGKTFGSSHVKNVFKDRTLFPARNEFKAWADRCERKFLELGLDPIEVLETWPNKIYQVDDPLIGMKTRLEILNTVRGGTQAGSFSTCYVVKVGEKGYGKDRSTRAFWGDGFVQDLGQNISSQGFSLHRHVNNVVLLVEEAASVMGGRPWENSAKLKAMIQRTHTSKTLYSEDPTTHSFFFSVVFSINDERGFPIDEDGCRRAIIYNFEKNINDVLDDTEFVERIRTVSVGAAWHLLKQNPNAHRMTLEEQELIQQDAFERLSRKSSDLFQAFLVQYVKDLQASGATSISNRDLCEKYLENAFEERRTERQLQMLAKRYLIQMGCEEARVRDADGRSRRMVLPKC